jgi:hypothetical protein
MRVYTNSCAEPVFDYTVLDAVEKVQMRIDELTRTKIGQQQLQLKFGDGSDLPVTLVAQKSKRRRFSALLGGQVRSWPAEYC